jgi:hypothetical protein
VDRDITADPPPNPRTPGRSERRPDGSPRTSLRRKYDYWCFEACALPPEAIQDRIARLRAYVGRPRLPRVRRYMAATRLEAYKWAYRARTGEGPSRADMLGDIPRWAIPGLDMHLTESAQGSFWMSWPVIIDGSLYACDAVMDRELGHERWWTWRGRPGEQKEYIGTFHSLRETRAAARRALGPSGQHHSSDQEARDESASPRRGHGPLHQ